MILLRRKRPLIRGAVVGGLAYRKGKNAAKNTDQDTAQPMPESADESSTTTKTNSDKDISSQLRELKELYDSNALTKDEFETAKKKVLSP